MWTTHHCLALLCGEERRDVFRFHAHSLHDTDGLMHGSNSEGLHELYLVRDMRRCRHGWPRWILQLVHEIHQLFCLASCQSLAHFLRHRATTCHHLLHIDCLLYGSLLRLIAVSIFDLASQSLVHFVHDDFILTSAAVKDVRVETLANMLPVHLLEELVLLIDTHVLHELLDGSYLRRIEPLQ